MNIQRATIKSHKTLAIATLSVAIMLFTACSSHQAYQQDSPEQYENHEPEYTHTGTLRELDDLYEWVMEGNTLTEDEFNSVFCPDIQFEPRRERCRNTFSTQEARDSLLDFVREGEVPFHVISLLEFGPEPSPEILSQVEIIS